MAELSVVDSHGVTWTVRRRWLPWRGPVSFREMWHSPDEKKTDTDDAATPEEPPSAVLRFLQLTVGLVLWLIIAAGKAVLIAAAAVFMGSLWLINLALQLLVLPFVLLARVGGVAGWPVQIDRQYKHFRTEQASDYRSAAALRDDVAARLQSGTFDGMHESAPEPA